MTGAERGFLLLSSHLGDPLRRPLSIPQLRTLGRRMQLTERPTEERDLLPADLIALGYGAEMAERIVMLLSEERLLDKYLKEAAMCDCAPMSRISDGYPLLLHKRLGLESPGCLWLKGDASFLMQPMIALVGSRELMEANRHFAEEVGRQAARQGYVLVSGNARGADRTAQDACLASGGQVISVVADELCKQPMQKNVLYVSEDGFNEPFSAQRALSRNRVIHALGLKTFVAQASLKMGGSWDGTVKNLRGGWSDVYCFDDHSEAMVLLSQMGANLIEIHELESIYDLPRNEENLFDR